MIFSTTIIIVIITWTLFGSSWACCGHLLYIMICCSARRVMTTIQDDNDVLSADDPQGSSQQLYSQNNLMNGMDSPEKIKLVCSKYSVTVGSPIRSWHVKAKCVIKKKTINYASFAANSNSECEYRTLVQLLLHYSIAHLFLKSLKLDGLAGIRNFMVSLTSRTKPSRF